MRMFDRAEQLELVEDLYRLRSNAPRIGSWVKIPLRNEVGNVVNISPSYENLCVHFGFYTTIWQRAQECLGWGVPLSRWETKWLKTGKKDDFRKKIMRAVWYHFEEESPPPVRGFMIHAMPSEDDMFYEDDMGEMKWKWNPHLFVVAAIPNSMIQARDQYGVSHAELARLAPQAMWVVVNYYCRFRKIKSFLEAKRRLGDWRQFLTPSQNLFFEQRAKAALL